MSKDLAINRLPPEFASLAGKLLSSRVYPEFFPLRGDERVLNIGCGDGPQIAIYAGRFAHMTCLDIQTQRLEKSRALSQALGLNNLDFIQTNVEQIPLPDASYDVILAIDIIEHVEHPERLLAEAQRLLKLGGRMLMTFPAMHDRFVEALSWLRHFGQARAAKTAWHPDDHAHELPLREWRKKCEQAGFIFESSRATTLFPPLHLYGVPRFWFSNGVIHAVDSSLARLPGLQNLGQTVMMSFGKKEARI